MRRISFALTEPQLLAGTKTVTRRLGWTFLEPGTQLLAVDRVRGLKPGQTPRLLGVLDVVSVRREPLRAITRADVVREGFPGLAPAQFVARFCEEIGCAPDTPVTRIEFEFTRLEGGSEAAAVRIP